VTQNVSSLVHGIESVQNDRSFAFVDFPLRTQAGALPYKLDSVEITEDVYIN
jgi:hypothetical protein